MGGEWGRGGVRPGITQATRYPWYPRYPHRYLGSDSHRGPWRTGQTVVHGYHFGYQVLNGPEALWGRASGPFWVTRVPGCRSLVQIYEIQTYVLIRDENGRSYLAWKDLGRSYPLYPVRIWIFVAIRDTSVQVGTDVCLPHKTAEWPRRPLWRMVSWVVGDTGYVWYGCG